VAEIAKRLGCPLACAAPARLSRVQGLKVEEPSEPHEANVPREMFVPGSAKRAPAGGCAGDAAGAWWVALQGTTSQGYRVAVRPSV